MLCRRAEGLPEAIETVWSQAVIKTCVVHLIRHSLRFVAYRDKKKVATDLKAIYTAASAEAALSELDQFAARWDQSRWLRFSGSMSSGGQRFF